MWYDLVRKIDASGASACSERSNSGRGLVVQAGPFDYRVATASGRGVTSEEVAMMICRNADRPGDRSYDISIQDFLKMIFG